METLPVHYTKPDLMLPPGDLWVFGYGSIMWRPGFSYMERRAARIYGYHRSLCVWSWVHRGTRSQPGLVFGLDLGGSCQGIAYHVPANKKEEVANYLYRRELVTDGYQAVLLNAYTCEANSKKGIKTALTFRANRNHPQYAGKLPFKQAADAVELAHGLSGNNPEYVELAIEQLAAMGVHDDQLQNISRILSDKTN